MRSFPTKVSIFVYCVLLFSLGSQKASMEFKGDENFYFESSKYMLETKDILTPRYMNEERFQKPILFYWFILLSFKIFGVNWFAARFVSILLGSFCALLIFKTAELLFKDKKTALFAALFAATTPLYYRYARLAVPDMSLIFFETLALYFFIRYYKFRSGNELRLFFVSLAVAFLIKGPVGAIIPLLIAAVFCLFKKEKLFRLSDVVTGLILFTLITVPWFYAMCRIYPGKYASQVLGREILQRLGWGQAGSFVMICLKGAGFYTVALITKFFPYSLVLPFAFAGACSTVRKLPGAGRDKRSESDGNLFLIIWAAVVFLFFTLVAERRTHYLLSLSPAASILVGAFFAGLARNKRWLAFGLVLSLSLLYIAINVFPTTGLFTNKMERAALSIKANMKEGDRIGIGSHGIIPEELQVFFQTPVEMVKVTYTADGRPSMDTAPRLKEFLSSQNRVFCVIKKKDYDTFLPEETRKNLYVIDTYFVWKRRITYQDLKESLNVKGPGIFRNIFQNEIYVVSNRR